MPLVHLLPLISQHALAQYPHEACGAWSHTPDRQLQLHPIPNIAPTHTASTQFQMDPLALLSLLESQDKGLLSLQGFYHSHPDQPPLLSAHDLNAALHNGKPLYPGLQILIVGVQPPQPCTFALYAWKHQLHTYCRKPLIPTHH